MLALISVEKAVTIPSTRGTGHDNHVHVVQAMIIMFDFALTNVPEPPTFIDLSQDFNRVWKEKLILKLNELGIEGTHVGIPGNELADSLAKSGALGHPEARESTTQLDKRDLLRTIKAQCLQEWKSNAAHDWYRAGEANTGKIVGKKGTRVYTILIHGQVKAYHRDKIRKRWRNGEEDESGDGERQPEHSRGAGPSAIISEVVRDRGYMESLSPGLTSQRSDQDSEVQSDTDDGKSLEPFRSLDPEALKEEGPVLRRNPPRARRPPGRGWRIWIPEKRQVVESRNCVFKEEILYNQPKRDRDTLPSVHFSSKEASFQEESNVDQPVDRETEELIGTTGGIDQLSETLPENLRSHPMTLRSHGKTAESPEEDNSGGQINATSAEDNNPTYEEAMNSPEVVNWIEAIEEERESLERHDVWQLQELPKGIKPLKCRWVLNKKINAVDGTTRYKARLVAKGFTQRRGIDYNEVYTPVSSFETIRLLTAIATEKDWFIDQFDVKSAYLHGTLNETIYMEQPECFKKPGEENLFCKLKKSIYGLKLSGRCWNKFLNKQLHEIGFQCNPIDPSIYEVELEEGRIILSIYVDDIFAISENQAARNKCRELLNSSFEVKYLGPISHMLGVSFKKSEDGSMTLSQSNYIEELLQRFRLQDAKGVSTPMETNLDLSVRKNGNSNERFPYRELIGGLSYLSQRTRPDIAYAVGILSRYCDNYTRKHWEAGKRVLRYLKSTKDFGITYRSTGKPLIAFSDASWASDIVDRKGVSGHLIILAGAPIIWRSTKQTVTALSTMESEYIALSSAVKDITWVRNLMEQLKMSSLICGETKVFCDNQAAISHAENYIDKSKTRHFAVKYHFVREKISEEAIELFYTPSAENPADFLTKPLARSQHEKYCRALMDYRNKRPAEVFPGGDMLDTERRYSSITRDRKDDVGTPPPPTDRVKFSLTTLLFVYLLRRM
ncbi:hypothetical protein LAZ67_18000390 [Cordylochernes scorpioides]|uniref:Reverse transcriptase Ty1/copia-type domain-containing protein n=1 Tax=Cordylochernes scorpioides TaxID=51811 RepID=A0ABY6LJ27_9ARAC|nr:hypothetical protein LAZ67_18000390 [Cordylochernes scorpioides]